MEAITINAVWAFVQIIAIDMLMAGDNAVVVGMAAANVPAEKRTKVITLGTGVAVIMRITLAFMAVYLLKIIGLTLVGGLLLAYVAYAMYREIRNGEKNSENHSAVAAKNNSICRAIVNIAMADLSMSLDNVLAVAGAANGHMVILALGLICSVAMMAVAANQIAKLIQRHRWIAWFGLLMVTYVAVMMIYHGSVEVVSACC